MQSAAEIATWSSVVALRSVVVRGSFGSWRFPSDKAPLDEVAVETANAEESGLSFMAWLRG
eukprot:5171491-Prorocentrum_lima.AAC.1